MGEPLLKVRGLRTWFHTRHGVAKAVDGIDFQVAKGEVLCIVGESGCGKSVTALSIMRLVPPPGRVESGEMQFDGRNLLDLSAAEMSALRGAKMSMVFQDPTSSLNPVFQVGLQISEVYEIHRAIKRNAGLERAGHGARLRAPTADRRRTNHGARRHYPGADSRSHA
jgi:ABC-type dipeptide/oligopeptide/nickel transport system ATPase component